MQKALSFPESAFFHSEGVGDAGNPFSLGKEKVAKRNQNEINPIWFLSHAPQVHITLTCEHITRKAHITNR
jgi:hypothetical protein